MDITQANSNDSLTAAEAYLAQIINAYRVQNGLSALRLSAGLSAIANRHGEDIVDNTQTLSHAWSDQPGVADSTALMNTGTVLNVNFPTSTGAIEEILAGYTDPTSMQTLQVSPSAALASWEGSTEHNAIILGSADGVTVAQASIGVAIVDGVAVAEFSSNGDPLGAPYVKAKRDVSRPFSSTAVPRSTILLKPGRRPIHTGTAYLPGKRSVRPAS